MTKRIFSKKMMQAHEKTMKAYEKMISYAKNKDNILDDVQDKSYGFYIGACRYCIAANGTNYESPYTCENCILSETEAKTFGCEMAGMMESKDNARDLTRFSTRIEIVEAFEECLCALAIEAEYVLTDGE